MISLQIFHFVEPRASDDGYKMKFHNIKIRQKSENEHVFEEDTCGYKRCLQDGRWWLIKTKKHPETDLERHNAVGRTMQVINAGRHYHVFNYNCEHLVTEIMTGKAYANQVPIPLTTEAGQSTFLKSCATSKKTSAC